MGIGAIVGTGIFVLTSEAAQLAGPAMVVSFVIAAVVCALTALCYAEMASVAPVSGSAYAYAYLTLGESVAWAVGWALVLEYALAASAVSVGWAGYAVGLLDGLFSVHLPIAITHGPTEGGIFNAPAAFVTLSATALLIVGTRESAFLNAILVITKIGALLLFIVITAPGATARDFHPFAPTGMTGISAAAASIFFAFVGFDAVATAAEETKNPQRNMPIGIIGSLVVCTLLYLFVAVGVIGNAATQPIRGSDGQILPPGSSELFAACERLSTPTVICSHEPLASVLRHTGSTVAANVMGLAAGLALPSVVLWMIYAQTRIFFAMARDGLLPSIFARLHPRYGTPHVVTLTTGTFVAVFSGVVPLGRLANLSNAGTLSAFAIVALSVLVLRRRAGELHRSFKVPAASIVVPLAVVGCVYLFWSLSGLTKILFATWAAFGFLLYASYGRRRSYLGRDDLPSDLGYSTPMLERTDAAGRTRSADRSGGGT